MSDWATRVIGTPVRDLSGQTIGHVKDFVLDKLSNDILFAVVGLGGFLSVGETFQPLPGARWIIDARITAT